MWEYTPLPGISYFMSLMEEYPRPCETQVSRIANVTISSVVNSDHYAYNDERHPISTVYF